MFDFFDSQLIRREYTFQGDTGYINIVSSSDGIRVIGDDVDSVRISYWECPGKHEYELTEMNGRFSLIHKDIISFLWGVHCVFLDTTMEIVVPREFAGVLDLRCSSGRVELAGVSTGSLKIESSSGSIRGAGIVSGGNVQLHASSGSINLTDISCADLKASTSSGLVHMDGIRAGKSLETNTSSGGVSLTNSEVSEDISIGNHSGMIRFDHVRAGGSVEAGNTSGGIHFNKLGAGSNITLHSTSGSIKGIIDGIESDYTISASTTSGLNNLGNSGMGSKELNAHTTSGGIKIAFTNNGKEN
ncbi:MAG: DUF4097 domain-containing protein [Lachnospiraceae bacterium]|nr:DUF4097 domain-containing protein [Lachnospiraceae bacterium]